jgi:hypothetical protein
VENLSSLKTFLKCFDLVSDLRTKFSKRNLIGVDVEAAFMSIIVCFLNCKAASVSFRYLEFSIMVNHGIVSSYINLYLLHSSSVLAWFLDE